MYLPFAGDAKGLQSRHQTQPYFPADGTARDFGPEEDPRGWELCVGHRKNCGSQQTQSQNSKEPLGAHARAGAVTEALAPSAAETLVGFSGLGQALQ